jgi:transposase
MSTPQGTRTTTRSTRLSCWGRTSRTWSPWCARAWRDGFKAAARGPIYVLLDNYPPHRTAAVQDMFAELGVIPLDFPAKSPEFNLIENGWGITKVALGKAEMAHPSKNPDEFRKRVKKVWSEFPKSALHNLYSSWKRRLLQCIQKQGAAFKYRYNAV